MINGNRRILQIALCGVACTIVAVTATGSARADDVTTVRADGVARATPSPDAPVDALTAGITDFGYGLSRLTAEPATNWVASPLSIGYAFSMARAGAVGDTAAELDHAFGFPPVGRDEAFNAATARVLPTDGRATVLVGNALFTPAGEPIDSAYLHTLAAQYGAGVHTVDFRSPAAARTINEWVGKQTAGHIRELFATIDPATRLVLANAVYLKADWQHPFGGRMPTGPAPFTRVDGTTVQAPTMGLQATLGYARVGDIEAVELPYQGDNLAMWVMLRTPTAAGAGSAAGAPTDLLTARGLASIRAALRPTSLGVYLPRWHVATTIDLAQPLRELGVRHAFDPVTADFGGIEPNLYVSQAVHRADITVDEKGTTAAAATGIGMSVTSALIPATVVRVDHPFVFAVVHRPTGLPLFTGQVADPLAG
jgi:serine protease inhibitor